MPEGLSAQSNRYLAMAVVIVMLLLCAQQLYSGAQFYSAYQNAKAITPLLPIQVKAKPKVDLRYDLFGTYQAQDSNSIPSSQLNIQLTGLYVATQRAKSQAILIIDGDEKVYYEGDSLPGGVKIYRIKTDRVILKRGENFESLRLNRNPLRFQPAPRKLDLPAF